MSLLTPWQFPHLIWAWVAILVVIPVACGDDQPATGPEVEAAKKFQAYAKETAVAYSARAENQDGRKLALKDESILRWSNPLGARKAHGEVFLWTDAGRPAAVLSMYEYTTADSVVHEHHEFCSLALTGLHFSSAQPIVWAPAQAGVELKPLPDAPGPASTPRQRLSQMRELAARFSGEKTTRQDETRALRLLSQPVYRYESKDATTLDGGLFAFVEATDPEIFLLLEARHTDGKAVWHYAVARMNSVRLQLSLGDKPVWQVDVLPWSEALNCKDLAYTAFQIR